MAKIHSGNPLATVPCVTGLTFIRTPKVWRRRLQPPESVHLLGAASGVNRFTGASCLAVGNVRDAAAVRFVCVFPV
ncbi:MAG: hypothetical protein ACK5YE_26680, partial [Planctomyces sp.]